MKIYFAHPVNLYGTKLESFLIQKIKEALPEYEVVNPADKEHGEGYERFKAETGNGMRYFEEVVLPSCAAGVFLAFRDGKLGAGIFKEVKWLYYHARSLWEIDVSGNVVWFNGPFYEVGRRTLSVDETRARIRDGAGKPRPF